MEMKSVHNMRDGYFMMCSFSSPDTHTFIYTAIQSAGRSPSIAPERERQQPSVICHISDAAAAVLFIGMMVEKIVQTTGSLSHSNQTAKATQKCQSIAPTVFMIL
jgi:hypothetical protein